MSQHTDDLRQRCADVLIDTMPPALKAALDEALARGESAATLLPWLRLRTGGPHARPGGTVYLACVAYLERRTGTEGGAS